MRLTYIKTGWVMTVRELIRNRFALILLFVIPSLFYVLVALTTSDRLLTFQLASISEKVFVEISERSESLMFIGLASMGLLTSFLALNLIQKHTNVNRRLVLCGYQSSELITSKLAVMVCAIILIGSYVSVMLLLFYQPKHLIYVIIGFILEGYIYGCYGLIIGAIFKRELEGILFVVLLVNIDAGWLQNPIYYADAQNKAIIHYLPAYFPSQTCMVSAFTDNSILVPLIWSIVYGSIFLFAALILFWRKMRIQR
jgi:hypothetical protein